MTDEQLVAASAHLAGNDEAFEFDLVPDDELEAEAAAKGQLVADARSANARALSRHNRIRKRVRSGYHPVPDINTITKDTWEHFVRGQLQSGRM